MLNRRPHPKWSFVTSFWAGAVILSMSLLVVFLLLHKPVWAELEFAVLACSIVTFLFYFYVLYHGVRFDRNEKYTITGRTLEIPTWLDAFNVADFGWFPDFGIDFGEGLIGAIAAIILGFLLAIVAVAALGLLIWLGANLVMVGVPVLFFPLYMVFRRAVRYVAAKGWRCYRKAGPSALFALRATVLNMAWVYVVIYLGHRLALFFHSIGGPPAG